LQQAQQIMKTTAGPFHFIHMKPKSDVIMLWILCVADFGHTMP
jgi:hypothetical protein